MTAGQGSDYTGAAALLDSFPMAQWMLADRGYDAELVPGCLGGKRHHALHPRTEIPRKTSQIRQAKIQKTQPHRDYVRKAQGLAAGRNPL